MTNELGGIGPGSWTEDDQIEDAQLEFYGIRALLEACIVKDTYAVPRSLVDPIILSDSGAGLLGEFHEFRSRMPSAEGKLAVALQFGWRDELFVSPSTDLAGLRIALGDEIRSGRILFPFVFGREAHDVLSTSFSSRARLQHTQSLEVLRATSPGVFQAGHSVVGPFGCVESLVARQMIMRPPAIPAYRCPDPLCTRVHNVVLTTGDSKIVKARRDLEKLLARRDYEGFPRRPRRFAEAYVAYTGGGLFEDPSSLIELLADTLSLVELQRVLSRVLRQHFRDQDARMRFLRSFGVVVQNPDDYCRSLNLAQCIQMLLYFSLQAVSGAVADAVADGRIEDLGDLTVRRPRIRRFDSGIPGQAELGRHGVRYRSADAPATQLAELLRALIGDAYATEDLAFVLGLPSDSQVTECVGNVYGDWDAVRVVDEIVMTNRHALAAALRHFGLDSMATASRHEQRARLLWQLGIDEGAGTAADSVATAVGRMQSLVEEQADLSRLRTEAAVLFPDLETMLLGALQFGTWALMNDHASATAPFTFTEADGAKALSLLPDDSEVGARLRGGGKPGLVDLLAGFGLLGRALSESATRLDELERAPSEYPAVCRQGRRPYAFPSRLPFLNLSVDSREAILALLADVARLGTEGVSDLRNRLLHGNSELPEHAEIARRINVLAECVRKIRLSGLYPTVSRRTRTVRNELGRGIAVYATVGGDVEVPVGYWPVTRGLPRDANEVLLLVVAANDLWGPLRFRRGSEHGSDPYWDGWPTQWKDGSAFLQSSERGPTADDSMVS